MVGKQDNFMQALLVRAEVKNALYPGGIPVNLEKFKHIPALRALAFMAALLMCQPSFAEQSDLNTPTGIEMAADLIIGRPALLATTVIGAAVWLVALPFSALGDNVKESGEQLVMGPARATFMRCLGCSTGDYKK